MKSSPPEKQDTLTVDIVAVQRWQHRFTLEDCGQSGRVRAIFS